MSETAQSLSYAAAALVTGSLIVARALETHRARRNLDELMRCARETHSSDAVDELAARQAAA